MTDFSFEQILSDTIKDTAKWAKRNFIYVHIILSISIISSFLASILVIIHTDSSLTWTRYLISFLTALTGLALTVSSTFKFDERARWFWKKNRLVEAYYFKIKNEQDPTVTKQLINEYVEKVSVLEDEWPGFCDFK